MSVRRDTIYNLSGQFVPLVVTLVTLPTFLGLIGESRYGVMAIAWVLLGYFGLFDFGMSRATAHCIARSGQVSRAERSEILWTAFIAICALGTLGGVLLWGLGHLLFGKLASVDEALRGELRLALPWLSLALPVTLGSSALTGALQGRERFLALNSVGVTAASLAQLVPLAVAVAGHVSLEWLVPATLAPRLLGIFVLLLLCRRCVPLTLQIRFNPARLRSLVGYGGWVTVSSVIGPLLAVADRLIIGKVLGPGAVTFYTIPHGLVSRGMVLAGSLSAAIFPRFAAQSALERDALMGNALMALTLAVTPIVFVAIWFVDLFFRLWVGPEVAARSVPVAEILLLGLWLNSLAYVAYARLQGEGNPKTVASIHLAELVPYTLLLWMLLPAWGIVGAAVAWTARVAADALLMLALSGTEIKTFGQLLAPFAILAGSMGSVLMFPPSSMLRWLLGGVFLAALGFWMMRQIPAASSKIRPLWLKSNRR